MIFMRSGKTIAHTRRSHNLFTLDLALPTQIMSAIDKRMVITGRGQPTHLVNKNIRTCL